MYTVTQPSHLLSWIVVVLNRLRPERVVFVDVGAARGDVLHAFTRDAGLIPPVFSIGIDPIDLRAARDYSAFVASAISNQDEGPTPFFRQESSDCSSLKRIVPSHIVYDRSLIDGIRYFSSLPIDRTLETLVVPCTRLSTIIRQFNLADQIVYEGQSTFMEDRAALEAAGFRLLGAYPFVVTPEADVLFVNVPLFERLVTPAATGDRAARH